MDFVWGEDAWCYVVDKPALIREAARLVKPGGVVAFTDWVEGPGGLSDAEAERFMRFMKFPTLASLDDYRGLLEATGLVVERAEDTGRFAPCLDLYIRMLTKQLTSDALRIIGFDMDLMQALGGEMVFMQELAHAQKDRSRACSWRGGRHDLLRRNGEASGAASDGGGSRPAAARCRSEGRAAGIAARWRPRWRGSRTWSQHCLRGRRDAKAAGPAHRGHPVRVHAARADPGGGRRARLPVRRATRR